MRLYEKYRRDKSSSPPVETRPPPRVRVEPLRPEHIALPPSLTPPPSSVGARFGHGLGPGPLRSQRHSPPMANAETKSERYGSHSPSALSPLALGHSEPSQNTLDRLRMLGGLKIDPHPSRTLPAGLLSHGFPPPQHHIHSYLARVANASFPGRSKTGPLPPLKSKSDLPFVEFPSFKSSVPKGPPPALERPNDGTVLPPREDEGADVDDEDAGEDSEAVESSDAEMSDAASRSRSRGLAGLMQFSDSKQNARDRRRVIEPSHSRSRSRSNSYTKPANRVSPPRTSRRRSRSPSTTNDSRMSLSFKPPKRSRSSSWHSANESESAEKKSKPNADGSQNETPVSRGTNSSARTRSVEGDVDDSNDASAEGADEPPSKKRKLTSSSDKGTGGDGTRRRNFDIDEIVLSEEERVALLHEIRPQSWPGRQRSTSNTRKVRELCCVVLCEIECDAMF